MKICHMNNPHKPILDEIWLAGENGFDCLELGIEYPEATPERLTEQKKQIEEALASYNLGVLAHSPWYFQFAHPYPIVRRAFVNEEKRVIQTAAEFGAKKLTYHVEFLGNIVKERKQLFALMKESASELLEECEKHDIKLCLENGDEKSFNLKEHTQFFEELPSLGLTLDVGHANLFPHGSDAIHKFIKNYRDRLEHVHIHDNRGKEDEHLPIGAGRINWEQVINNFKSAGYNETFTLEIHSHDREYLRISKEKFQKLWNNL